MKYGGLTLGYFRKSLCTSRGNRNSGIRNGIQHWCTSPWGSKTCYEDGWHWTKSSPSWWWCRSSQKLGLLEPLNFKLKLILALGYLKSLIARFALKRDKDAKLSWTHKAKFTCTPPQLRLESIVPLLYPAFPRQFLPIVKNVHMSIE